MNILRLSALASLLFTTAASSLQARTFTPKAGSRVDAEVIEANDQFATLQTRDKKRVVMFYSNMSDADRAYVQSWIKQGKSGEPRRAAPPSGVTPQTAPFKITWTKDRVNSKLEPNLKDVGNPDKQEEWMCHFEVTNPGRDAVSNVLLKYEVRCKYDTTNVANQNRLMTGEIRLPTLEGFRSVRADSQKFKLLAHATVERKTNSETGLVYKTGTNFLTTEEIEGVVVTLIKNDRVIFEYISPGIRSDARK